VQHGVCGVTLGHHASELGDGFYHEDSWHDWLVWEMPGEKGFAALEGVGSDGGNAGVEMRQ
jgi:hypothetical protein